MNYIGYDGEENKLQVGDICTFKIAGESFDREGIIIYDDAEYAYCFEMQDGSFPVVLMNKTKLGTIKKIVSVWETKVNDERFKWYQEITNSVLKAKGVI